MTSLYDGVAEVWLENEAAMETLRTSPEYLTGALADEPNFIDLNRVEWMLTNDHVLLDGPQTAQQAKLIFQLKRKPVGPWLTLASIGWGCMGLLS